MPNPDGARTISITTLLAVAALLPWPLLLGPNNWWAFILISAAIMGVLRLLIGRQWRRPAGLDLPPAHVLMTGVAFAAIAIASNTLLQHAYETAGLRATPPGILQQAGFLFQAFNEEILACALLIGFLIQYVRPAVLVSLGVAVLFSAAHFLLYRFSNPMHLALSLAALTTLFFAGVAMNNLFLAFRHIGFSWALHAGWNVIWLPATIYDAASNRRLNEPEVFDRVLGAPAIVVLAFLIAALSFVFLDRRAFKTSEICH